MIQLLNLPSAKPTCFRPSDVTSLAFGTNLISKGLAEDFGSNTELRYELEKVTIRYFLRLFVKALYLGTCAEITGILETLPKEALIFVDEIGTFLEEVWQKASFYQKAILYYLLVNEYSYNEIANMLQASPSIIRRQIRAIAEILPMDTKFDRLHEIILSANNGVRVKYYSDMVSNLIQEELNTEKRKSLANAVTKDLSVKLKEETI